MNIRLQIYALCLLIIGMAACTTEKEHLITIETSHGNMHVVLFDETPKHKENFLKLAREGKYDSTNFHRIIEGFMVQGGDVGAGKNTADRVKHTIPAEFRPELIHEKGALAAAREGDAVNPEQASSGDQFYIVQGTVYSPEELKELAENRILFTLQNQFMSLLKKEEYRELREEAIALQRSGDFNALQRKIMDNKELLEKEFGPVEAQRFNDHQVNTYTSVGGAPHLDGTYTVFGKVISGLEVIDAIAATPTDGQDKPESPVYMVVKVEEMKKKDIEEAYGYKFPVEITE